MRKQEKLYRKDNKTTIRYHGTKGLSFRHDRNTKRLKEFEGNFMPMKKEKLGMDYTPLFKFLLSKVGQKWNNVYSEAVKRLDKEEPIFWMIIPNQTENKQIFESGVIRLGENTQYSALTVDENGILVKIKPDALPYKPSCTCCTHTFNGKIININNPSTYREFE